MLSPSPSLSGESGLDLKNRGGLVIKIRRDTVADVSLSYSVDPSSQGKHEERKVLSLTKVMHVLCD